eukprot:TRINITY_DN208_c2_g1_i1.p1 TRINITY_DN208_c2_g1~~TRINITY_DN208_c2_g1_i1.p1  ORF type:complete len:118 (-),score=9.15 TRINITY_DN208_c2_g1_i1:242-595(-)
MVVFVVLAIPIVGAIGTYSWYKIYDITSEQTKKIAYKNENRERNHLIGVLSGLTSFNAAFFLLKPKFKSKEKVKVDIKKGITDAMFLKKMKPHLILLGTAFYSSSLIAGIITGILSK